MRRQCLVLILFVSLLFPGTGHSQGSVTALDELLIEFWPDYDRASVLALFTGTLPPDTELPTSVTLPLPQTAQLNAVARIDDKDGKMKDDIFYSDVPGEITFILPDHRFRLEYYFPYTAEGNRRTFDFTWKTGLSVKAFQLRVQQPAFATSLATIPPSTDVLRGEDGLTYYAFPVKSIGLDESFSLRVDYALSAARLSIDRAASPSAGPQGPGLAPTSRTDKGIDWPVVALIAGSMILVFALGWIIAVRRTGGMRPGTPQVKARGKSRAGFCRKCGNPIGRDDRFCRACGVALHG